MDVREKTARLNYQSEYNRLKDVIAKQNEENAYMRAELKDKKKELQYYYGFEEACKLIFGRRYENGCQRKRR